MAQPSKAPRYQIPTHLQVPDKIDIPLFGMTISLTIRQGVLFFFGLGAALNLWRHTTSWQTVPLPGGIIGPGTFLHWSLPALLALATFLFAMGQVRGKTGEMWGVLLLRYLTTPRIFVWQSVAAEHLISMKQRNAEEEAGTLMDEYDEEEGITI